MKRTYGGVKNSKAYEEVQEASVVGESKPVKPINKGSLVIGIIIFALVTHLLAELLLIITGLNELLIKIKTPAWVYVVIPFTPTIVLIMWLLFARIKKRTR